MNGKLVLLASVAMLAISVDHSKAQEIGHVRAGFTLAQHLCAECHAIGKDKLQSPNEESPSFQAVASLPGMNGMALTAALNTSHRNMPNVILNRDEQADVIAYILSLK